MSKTRGAAAAAAVTTEARPENDPRPRQGDPLEEQVVEPATQPIVSEGSPSMHAMVRGDRPGVNDASAAADDAIAARAYELYQARGGTHGADMDDWLQAERELWGERQQSRAGEREGDLGPSEERDNPAHRPID
jgi:Protein of unknown function (DUF2934)